ncbi:Lysophospholipid transporter LplT [Kushneria phyllosphaerae]|uniref:Lysophospholipid transporter LplT n=2 Tax=Kushneria phyllosphaerae TaxID=2100822 RepID=A0A2R8CMG8_9GAMM|nr:Lysophospholipid transporter LplT [Kushneria phyllosphaerae]
MRNVLSLMRSRFFAPFFWTQALGAFNDNVFKNVLLLLVTFVAVPRLGWDAGLINNLAAALFILPYLLFSAWGGQLADYRDKRQLIIALKWLELATMTCAALAIWLDAYALLLGLLFMMGTQSALFGPVKYAILPQHVQRTELVQANAWVEMGTFLAILLGTLGAGILMALGGSHARVLIGATLVVVSLCGLGAALLVPPAPAQSRGQLKWQPFRGSWQVLSAAWRAPRIFRALIGISMFWFLGACYLTQLPLWTSHVVHGQAGAVTMLLAAFAVGVGLGSLVCARLSAGRLEVGLVPIGAFVLALAGLDFAVHPALGGSINTLADLVVMPRFWWMLLDLTLIGIGGGLYIIPLYTLVQMRSSDEHRARMIAANNILNALFMVLSAAFGAVMIGVLEVSLHTFFASLAVISLITALVCAVLQARPMMRISIFVLVHMWYRLRIRGIENIPDEGAAIVVCNHVSFMDALVMGGASPRPLRFLMDKPIYESPGLSWFFRMAGAIPVASERRDPKGMRRALDMVSKALQNGEVVMLFPEGRLTRTGHMNEFRRGIDLILKRDPVPVVPAALSGLWGSWSSRYDGLPFKGMPRRFRARVCLSFGAPVDSRTVTRESLQTSVGALKTSIDGYANNKPFRAPDTLTQDDDATGQAPR